MIAEHQLLFATATEDELNQLFHGLGGSVAAGWNLDQMRVPTGGDVGVVLEWDGTTARPAAIVAHEDALRRLYGRFSHVRDEFSPLSVWTHILTPRFVEALDGDVRPPELSNCEAAWAGLAVAEAQFLSGSSLQSLRINACLATQSFAVARAISLWPHISTEIAAERYDQTRRLLRNNGSQRGVEVFRPIWEVLAGLSIGRTRRSDSQHRLMLESAERLTDKINDERVNAAGWIFEPITPLTGVDLRTLENSPPEHRLHTFDALASNLNDLEPESFEYAATAMQAGFVATIAAGGAPSLSLAEGQMHRHPMVLGWAYALGSLGERVLWTSSFDGLGRLIARELVRPFYLADPPTCDFDFNELRFLADPDLKDPLVHLRIKQARSVQVALFPGVNVVFPLSEASRIERTERKVAAAAPQTTNFLSRDVLPMLADALAPYLEKRLSSAARPVSATNSNKGKSSRKKRSDQGNTRTLPFGKK